VIEPLADDRFVTVRFDPQEGVMTGEVDESIEIIAFSQSLVDETTERVRYSVLFESESAVSESAVEDTIAVGQQQPDSNEIEFTQEGRQLIAEFSRDLPPYRLPDDSPDASFSLGEEGSVLVQSGSEPVSPANLDLRVDGGSVDPPWGDREEPIEPGERFDVEFDPFSFVAVYWLDPEREDVEQPLGRDIVGGRDAFEGEYDTEADELTVTYTGDPAVEADRFELTRFSADDSAPLELKGTEADMHEYVDAHPDEIEDGLRIIEHERDTPYGSIDFLGTDTAGRPVVMEVKRRQATLTHVDQLRRYLARYRETNPDARGMLIAPAASEKVRRTLRDAELEFVELDAFAQAGTDHASTTLTHFQDGA
jgi:hypothetical protein